MAGLMPGTTISQTRGMWSGTRGAIGNPAFTAVGRSAVGQVALVPTHEGEAQAEHARPLRPGFESLSQGSSEMDETTIDRDAMGRLATRIEPSFSRSSGCYGPLRRRRSDDRLRVARCRPHQRHANRRRKRTGDRVYGGQCVSGHSRQAICRHSDATQLGRLPKVKHCSVARSLPAPIEGGRVALRWTLSTQMTAWLSGVGGARGR